MECTTRSSLIIAAIAVLLSVSDLSASVAGFDVDVLVDGSARREYLSNGTIYVEAVKGREYTLRLTNPTPRRVAVALSVDGLNTIDAKHTSAKSAAKWVIDPYDTIEISGWQVSDRAARSFYFTGERDSYGAALGQTENLGVIEAVFFVEREPDYSWWFRNERQKSDRAAPAPAGSSAGREMDGAGAQAEAAPDDEYAATGMGDRRRHDVRSVQMNLEDHPVASVRIRYEFRKQLVDLGIIPSQVSPLDRRESARGFNGFCPEPNAH